MIGAVPEAGVGYCARLNVAFSPRGRWGASLSSQHEDLVLEQWSLTSAEPVCQAIPDVAVDRRTQLLPLDDGRILLLRSKGTAESGRHGVLLLSSDRHGVLRQRLADIPALGGYLLPSLTCGQLGFLVTLDNPEHSTIWRLSASHPHADPLLRVPGSLSGGVWLDGDCTALAVNQFSHSHRCSGLVIDLAQQSWRRVWSMSDTSIDRIVLAHPRSKLLVVTTNSAGEERIGWGMLGTSDVHFPETLHRPGSLCQALALDDSGERLLVRETAGAVSRLQVYRPADDRLTPLTSPPGSVAPPVCWTGDLIRFRFSAPDQPPTLATLEVTRPQSGADQAARSPRWWVSRDEPVDGPTRWAPAELVELPGPAGPIEAITYGGPDWRSSRHLVLALHGGPLSQWRFEFDPLFQSLAQAGVAVVAPNYRGSTGYGDAYLRAVVGRWGGPDLDDVTQLGRSLGSDRHPHNLPEPVVLGVSYGAFLALLAACHEPELWSGCVALAPFLSGPSLHRCANAVVRQRIEHLGALTRIDDARGPRDVLRSCSSLTAPLLLVHGRGDDTIPVQQSRLLWQRLSELGKTDDVEYLEIDGNHQQVALAWPTVVRQKIVNFCLARAARRAGPSSSRQVTRDLMPALAEGERAWHPSLSPKGGKEVNRNGEF